MVKGLGREDFNNYSWMDRANTTAINILFTFLDLDDICKDIEGELSSKLLGVGFVSQSNKIEEFSEHRRYLLSYINDVLYDISDYLEEPLYKGFHEAMDIMATIDMTDGKTDNTIGLQVDVKVSGRGMSYTNKQKMSELTLEDFIGSRYQETNGNSYVRNTYSQKVDGFANLFAKDYETYLKYSKIKQEESSLDAYLKSTVLKEFAHKKDSPFLIELLQQLSELTVVIPIYEAYKGKTLITNDNLTKTEERYKLISATVNAFTLGHGAIISGGGGSLAKLFASEIIAEVAVSSTVIGCEKAGVPTSVTFALALLAGAGAGAVSNKVLFKDYGIKVDDLDIEKLGKGGTAIEGTIKTKLDYVTSNGLELEVTPGNTTTILGTYNSDTGAILDELGNVKSLDFGPRDGGFNLLNTPDELYRSPEQFWKEYNKPWLDNVIARNDIIKIVTEPSFSNLTRINKMTGKVELTGFGREFTYLRKSGFHYDDIQKIMTK
jgi:hypothetical protein